MTPSLPSAQSSLLNPTRCMPSKSSGVAPFLSKTSTDLYIDIIVFVLNSYLSFHPWTPNCYRPATMTANMAITSAIIELPNRGASLLEFCTSKGLPPPLVFMLGCEFEFAEDVAWLGFVVVFFVLVVLVVEVDGKPPPRPPSADSIDEVVVEWVDDFAA